MRYNIIIPGHQNAGGEYDDRVLLDVESVNEQEAWNHLMSLGLDIKASVIQGRTSYWYHKGIIKLEIKLME